MTPEKRSQKAGLPPGSLVHIGVRKTHRPRISLIEYTERKVEERSLKTIEEAFPYIAKRGTITWINVDGIHDPKIIEKIGKRFRLHPLLLEDVMDSGQRPKIDDYGDYIFLILKMLYYDEDTERMRIEQVSLILGPNYVISFQEREGDVFDPIRERIRKGKGRIRKARTDYLAYSLLDAIVDNYFTVLESLGEDIETMQEEVVANPSPKTLRSIQKLKRHLIMLRRSIWPIREVAESLERAESPLIKKTTAIYLRDVYDHTMQVIDSIETFREMLSAMFDMYISGISNRLNEIMKVLTIIGTIFIPLTFITGLYGMNFRFMPEINWRYGYFFSLSVMGIVALLMIGYFHKKKWI